MTFFKIRDYHAEKMFLDNRVSEIMDCIQDKLKFLQVNYKVYGFDFEWEVPIEDIKREVAKQLVRK
tara:strand:- start:397 stop:594 length:198 start_codon:yes stop_codon:yes gene_type:complete